MLAILTRWHLVSRIAVSIAEDNGLVNRVSEGGKSFESWLIPEFTQIRKAGLSPFRTAASPLVTVYRRSSGDG